MKNKFLKNKIKLNWWQSALVLPFIAGAVLLLEMNLMPGGIMTAWHTFTTQEDLLELNYFPVFATIVFLYLLLGNAFYAGAGTTLLWGALSYANLLKIDGRDDPLTPTDIALIREAADAVGEYNLDMHWGKVIPFILLLIVLVFSGIKLKSCMRGWKVRLPLALATLAILCFQVPHTYTDKTRYYNYEVETRYNVALEYNTLGFNYCFLYNYNLYPVDKPENFDKAVYEALSKTGSDESPAVKPNVLFIMCEAFSDLSDEDMFAYSGADDPLKDWHALLARENAFDGRIAVSNYAAGTANTEFNVMTGMQTNSIGEGLTSSFRVLHDDTVSVASILKDDGYDTFFMHPGKAWFYNRQNVYRYFGIRDQIFEEAFDDSDYKGQMISDEAFGDELLDDLKTRLEENDAPLFTYAVTIENHQAYKYYKFDFEPAKVPMKTEVSAETAENLEVYMEGVRDSAALALRLADYADDLNEPTVLVFFGDHRPNLGGTYAELGLNFSEGGDIETYEVPFVIYLNDDYAKALASEKGSVQNAFDALDIPEGSTISDNYLGAAVLELMGYGTRDPYFAYLNELRREHPFYRLPASCGADEGLGDEISALLHDWTYYRIKY